MNVLGVLILSADALAAALIGAAVELAGHMPLFSNEGENPRETMRRVRPDVVLVDCDHEEACTEAFFGPAMMVGARVVVFSSGRSERVLEPIAKEFGVRTFVLPIDVAELSRVLVGAPEDTSPS